MSLHIQLAGRPDEIPDAVSRIRHWSELEDQPVDIARKLAIAADEILNNIVSYGFVTPGGHDVSVRLERSGSRIICYVSDDGIPFDPLVAEAPDT